MIYRMGAGEDVPFEAEYLIHVWNRNLEELQQETEQLRLIATNLQCGMMMHDLTVQAEAQFLKTFPAISTTENGTRCLRCTVPLRR